MSARILDYRHSQAARERRAARARAADRKATAEVSRHNRRSTLDEIMGTSFDPRGGAA